MNIAHITQRLTGVHMPGCSGEPCDCGAKDHAALHERIDASIARLEEAIKLKRDRRNEVVEVEEEKRDGFDRRERPGAD